MYGYIYLIVNNVNGHTYVGQKKLHSKSWNKDGYMGSGTVLQLAKDSRLCYQATGILKEDYVDPF